MKFERLVIERFGQFESLDLDLSGESGLVLVHGPNEAGKSTLLRAIHGLLFGIDERSPDNFRFPYPAMALTATLRDGAGQRIDITRRKRRKDALLGTLRTDLGELPLDEPRFTRYFGAVTEDLYRQIFGFHHDDLQRGADVLQVAGLGELLGGGALGGSAESLRRVLGGLHDEAEDLYKGRGKNPPINRALTQLHDTRAALRDATLQQAQYLTLTSNLKIARDTQSEADVELARLRQRAARIHTLLLAFEDFHEHQRLERRLADPDLAVPLAHADALRVAPLLAELHALEQRHQALALEIDRLERRAAHHPVDHALLAEAATVERLLRRVEPVAAQRHDLPRTRARLLRDQSDLRAQLAHLSPPPPDLSQKPSPRAPSDLSHEPSRGSPRAPHDLSQRPPDTVPEQTVRTSPVPVSPAELEQIRLALTRWQRTRQELALVSRTHADDDAELAALTAAGAALAAQLPDDRGRELLAALEPMQADHAELGRTELELLRLTADLDLALARLHPRPAGDPSRFPLPAFAAVQDLQARRQQLDADRREARHDLSQQTAELARLDAELAALAVHDLPDPALLPAVRSRRDDAWSLVRQRLLAPPRLERQRDLFAAEDIPAARAAVSRRDDSKRARPDPAPPPQPDHTAKKPPRARPDSGSPTEPAHDNSAATKPIRASSDPGPPTEPAHDNSAPTRPIRASSDPGQPTEPAHDNSATTRPIRASSDPGQPTEPAHDNSAPTRPIRASSDPGQPTELAHDNTTTRKPTRATKRRPAPDLDPADPRRPADPIPADLSPPASEPQPADVPHLASHADPKKLARAYERAVVEADIIADRLRGAAERLAQKTALDAAADRARLALAHTRDRLTGIGAAEHAWTAAWADLWRPLAVTPSSPTAMLAWLTDAAAVRDLAAAHARLARDAERLRPRVHAFEARLRDHLAAPCAAWPALVHQLREQERRAEHLRGRLESAQAQATTLRAALARTAAVRALLERDLQTALAELRQRTAALGLPPDIDPESALRRLDALHDLADRLAAVDRQLAATDQALAALADFDAEVAALRARLTLAPPPTTSPPSDSPSVSSPVPADSPLAPVPSNSLSTPSISSPVPADSSSTRPPVPADSPSSPPPSPTLSEHYIEHLARALADARAAATTHALARDESADRRREQSRLHATLTTLRSEAAALRTRAGLADDAALADLAERALHRAALTRTRDELGLRLARALGEGEPRAVYAAELQTARREALESEQHALTTRISDLDQRRIAAVEQRGRLEHEAQQLGGDRAARLGAELEVLRADLEDHADRYILLHLAERVLGRVADRYARDNQPAILQYTSDLLARITAGRHVRVVAQPETRTLAALGRDGQLRLPAELSSGTREQLFLALRLAYVLDYCDRCEPLPVVMDDVLVNFDDTRAAAALAALRDLGKSTQVILLTCHRRWLDLAPAAAPDARILELPPEPLALPALPDRAAEA